LSGGTIRAGVDRLDDERPPPGGTHGPGPVRRGDGPASTVRRALAVMSRRAVPSRGAPGGPARSLVAAPALPQAHPNVELGAGTT